MLSQYYIFDLLVEVSRSWALSFASLTLTAVEAAEPHPASTGVSDGVQTGRLGRVSTHIHQNPSG